MEPKHISAADESPTVRVREWVQNHIVQPAKARGDRMITVTAGEVHNQLGLTNRVPIVCQALRSKRFLESNHLVLKDMTGPPSGLSTTVKFTYEIISSDTDDAAKKPNPLWDLLGIGKVVFGELGGGESFIKNERAKFSAAMEAQATSQTKREAEFTAVWQSVVAHAGEKFSTVKGLPFRYVLAGDSVRINRDNHIIDQALARGEFRKAWERWPVSGPGELQDLRGPSYIFAILSDARVRKDAGH